LVIVAMGTPRAHIAERNDKKSYFCDEFDA
jgi:hypothetical protein